MVKLAEPALATEEARLHNVAWVALQKVAAKQKQDELLEEGNRHTVNLKIEGDIDGRPFQESFRSVLSIGHSQTRASSVTPRVPELIAWILGKLNQATRNRILSDVPEEFSDNGDQIPPVSEILLSEVEHMLGRLRSTKKIDVKGAVRCEYSI